MKQVFTLLFLSFIINAFGQSGELDANFGVGGFVITTDHQTGNSIAVMPDDRIVMVGGISRFEILRFMADGTPDMTFGNSGSAFVDMGIYNDYPFDVAVQPDGKVVVIGVVDGDSSTNDQAVGVARLNADGTLDTTFNGTGKLIFDFEDTENHPYAVALQTNGKIVVAGYTGASGSRDYAVVRINEDGTFDTTFDFDGKQTINVQGDDNCRSVAVQPDGKIVLGGSSYPVGSNTSGFAAVRLNADGSLDTTFSGDGIALAKIGFGNDTVYGMALQPDGKILLAADSYIPLSQDVGVVRFTADGELDTTFSGDGKFNTAFSTTSDYVDGITLQPDGKIIVAGAYYATSDTKMALYRITANGELDTTFNGDGKADYDVPGNNGVQVADVKLQSTGQILVSGYAADDFMLARILSGTELAVPQWNENTVSFYPNPAKNTIHFNADVTTISIVAADGKKVMDKPVSGNQADVSGLAKGIYFVRMTSVDGKASRQKLVVD